MHTCSPLLVWPLQRKKLINLPFSEGVSHQNGVIGNSFSPALQVFGTMYVFRGRRKRFGAFGGSELGFWRRTSNISLSVLLAGVVTSCGLLKRWQASLEVRGAARVRFRGKPHVLKASKRSLVRLLAIWIWHLVFMLRSRFNGRRPCQTSGLRVRQHESGNTDARVRQQKGASQTTERRESDNQERASQTTRNVR